LSLSADFVHGRDTGFAAFGAGLAADAAMLVTHGVTGAFLAANPADFSACVQDPQTERFRGGRPARQDGASGLADIRAIKIETNTFREFVNQVLCEAGVGAGNAGLRAIIAGLDRLNDGVADIAMKLRMGREDLLDMHRKDSASRTRNRVERSIGRAEAKNGHDHERRPRLPYSLFVNSHSLCARIEYEGKR
jgi:hypothetical protein